METMQALRIEVVGDVTSFRYPHFMWRDPHLRCHHPLRFTAIFVAPWAMDRAGGIVRHHFTHDASFNDLEHIHAGGMVQPVSAQKRKELYARATQM